MPNPKALACFNRVSIGVLEEGIAKDPVTKKVHDSYFAFMTKYRSWSGYSEKVYHEKILAWRREQAFVRTQQRRPDLLPRSDLKEGPG